MGKRKLDEEKFAHTKCPHDGCEKVLKNENNYKLHIKSCSKKKVGRRTMMSYYQVSTINNDSSNVLNADVPTTVSSLEITRTANDGVASSSDVTITSDVDNTVSDVITSTFEAVVQSRMCEGADVDIDGSFYRLYPFHRHDSNEQSLVLKHNIQIHTDPSGKERLVAHSKLCNSYLNDDFIELEGKFVNKLCVDIVEGSSYKKMLEVANSDDVDKSMKLEMLNCTQLQVKYRDLREQMNNEKLLNLNLARKNARLTKQLSLNKRLVEIIGTNDIPRLSTLIKVCINSGMGVQSIIGRLSDAIRGKYHANYSEMEKDVAVLVYKIGGPRLLHIMHVSHGLPGLTTTFDYCKQKQGHFSAGVDGSFDNRIKHNMSNIQQDPHKISTIKMDEIATESRLRWNNPDNSVLGLCYQHSHNHSMKFDSMDDIHRIKGLTEAGTCHITKESLVVALGEVSSGGHIDPILSLPSCCKTESEEFVKMIDSIFRNVISDIVATDGDAMRRKTFYNMSKPIKDQEVKMKLRQCPLFDLNIINGEKGVYFDDKHCAKRLRGILLSESRGCKVDGFVVARDQLHFICKKAEIPNYKEALNPADRQNVQAVLKLHKIIQKSINYGKENGNEFPGDMLSGLKSISFIFDCILCAFAMPTISLKEQLTKFSTLSHALLYLYKKGGTAFIPGQLYHDLQRMVQGAYFATAVLQKRGGGKLHIYQLGTDQLERLFASVRTVTHSRNCDALELCHRLQHSKIINNIILKHPTWKRTHGRRLIGLKDYSSETEWTGDLDVNSCVLPEVWMAGRAHAVEHLHITDEFFSGITSGVTMLRPNKRVVGVTIDEERIEPDLHLLEEDCDDDDDDVEEANAAAEIEEALADVPEPSSTSFHSNMIEFEGKNLYKVSVMKEVFSGDNYALTSTDRLKRVRGYSKFCNVGGLDVDELDLDGLIMVGDFIAGKVICEKQTTFCLAKILSLKDKESAKFRTAIPSEDFASTMITGRIMSAKVCDASLMIHQSSSVHEVMWDGLSCTTIEVKDLAISLVAVKDLLSHLPIASSKVIYSSLLPYDPSLVDATDHIPSKEKLPCKLCDQHLEKKQMRLHVGRHILEDRLCDVCGFCGTSGCSIELVKSSGKGATTTLGPKSNCSYYCKFSLKSAERTTKSSPCTNRPVSCPICKVVVWSYMMDAHYNNIHQGSTHKFILSEEESSMVLSKK